MIQSLRIREKSSSWSLKFKSLVIIIKGNVNYNFTEIWIPTCVFLTTERNAVKYITMLKIFISINADKLMNKKVYDRWGMECVMHQH